MNESYTRKQAMERLGIMSINAFLHLARKYPEIFVNVNRSTQRDRYPWYDKAAIDKFAEEREYFKADKTSG